MSTFTNPDGDPENSPHGPLSADGPQTGLSVEVGDRILLPVTVKRVITEENLGGAVNKRYLIEWKDPSGYVESKVLNERTMTAFLRRCNA